jgi:hypothetical protein
MPAWLTPHRADKRTQMYLPGRVAEDELPTIVAAKVDSLVERKPVIRKTGMTILSPETAAMIAAKFDIARPGPRSCSSPADGAPTVRAHHAGPAAVGQVLDVAHV